MKTTSPSKGKTVYPLSTVAGKKGGGGGNIFFISPLLQEPSPTPIPLKLRRGFLFGLPPFSLPMQRAHRPLSRKVKKKNSFSSSPSLAISSSLIKGRSGCVPPSPYFFLTFLLPLYIQVGKMTNWRRFPPFFFSSLFLRVKCVRRGGDKI